jgi:hypothetical protein
LFEIWFEIRRRSFLKFNHYPEYIFLKNIELLFIILNLLKLQKCHVIILERNCENCNKVQIFNSYLKWNLVFWKSHSIHKRWLFRDFWKRFKFDRIIPWKRRKFIDNETYHWIRVAFNNHVTRKDWINRTGNKFIINRFWVFSITWVQNKNCFTLSGTKNSLSIYSWNWKQ